MKSNIEYLVGGEKIEFYNLTPYHEVIIDFVSEFSKLLNLHSETKNFPDLKALSFWCRKKNIEKFKKNFFEQNSSIRMALGLVFHITPSNIPTNFAYSLLFGLLTGNSNIVKVPTIIFPQIEIISLTLKKILNKNKFRNIKKMIKIIRYSENDDFTSKLSSICDARLIWGGDNSIKNIRKFKLKERSLDLAFSDRFSFSLIDAKKLKKLNNYDFNRLIQNFYNDTYLVDQNACSSPHLVVWLNGKNSKIKKIFWENLNSLIEKKYFQPDIASIDKYTNLCESILKFDDLKNYKKYSNLLYVMNFKRLNNSISEARGKWGFFYDYDCINLNSLNIFINKSVQTLTYFGVPKKTILKFIIKNKIKGIDRIVPIGQALDINLNWDGYDLNKFLTRIIDLK